MFSLSAFSCAAVVAILMWSNKLKIESVYDKTESADDHKNDALFTKWLVTISAVCSLLSMILR